MKLGNFLQFLSIMRLPHGLLFVSALLFLVCQQEMEARSVPEIIVCFQFYISPGLNNRENFKIEGLDK